MLSKSDFPDNVDFKEGEIILIDKPKGISSFDVIREIKSLVKIKKIGHTGTLDPLASGLMILCTGKKTKLISQIQDQFKIYIGDIRLGYTTPSFDGETEPDAYYDYSFVNEDLILETSKYFNGKIEQFPPSYSALKFKGKRMYKLVKQGIQPEIKSRQVEIFEFSILNIHLPYLTFYVKCSKGTYIRSLAHDFGKKLNSGSCLSDLRRTSIGEFQVNNALSLNEFSEKIKLVTISEL